MENTVATTSTTPAEFALTDVLPGVDTLFADLEPLLRFLVMVGPLALLGLGLYYFLMPPGEANHSMGYRFRYGMSRVAVWQFMQRLAGIVFGALGLVLTVVMALLCLRLDSMKTMDALWYCVKCIGWEIGLVVEAHLAVNITVMARYDSKGNLRSEKKYEE